MHIDKHFSNVNMPELTPGLLSICSPPRQVITKQHITKLTFKFT